MAEAEGSISIPTSEPQAKKQKLDEDALGEPLQPITDKDNISDDKIIQKDSDEVKKDENVIRESSICKHFRGAVVETDVGITEYISESKGFTGILKQRFSDFLVNEIDIDGNLVELTDLSNPDTQQTTTTEEPKEPAVCVLTEAWKEQLQKLVDGKNPKIKVEMMVGDDKEFRSKIHSAIREHYKGLDSSTGQKDGQRCITAVFKPFRTKAERNRDQGSSIRQDYCQFTMYKENKDTMEAIGVLAKLMHLKPGQLTFAGTKDKRGKTCQQVSAHRVTATRLHQLNKCLRGMAIGNFKYSKRTLKLGDLSGNRFIIILRSLSGELDDINSSLESLRQHGFINYYGLQRFGTTSVPTHHVGRAMLQRKWSDAIDLILQPRDGDRDDMTECRKIWAETKDAEAALKKAGRFSIERTLLTGLHKNYRTDYLGALSELPRNTRLMYVHAYQSYMWNVIASRRLKEFGLTVIEGDLILPATAAKVSSSEKAPVTVTAKTIGNYSVHDIVLPLPGWDVLFPANMTGYWYHRLLEDDGLTKEDLKNKVRDYSLPGDYRHLVVKPGTVKWNVLNYEEATQPLVLSDLETLKQQTLPEQVGSQRALKLELSLPSSTYATMALREVLRADTSAYHQASLNKH